MELCRLRVEVVVVVKEVVAQTASVRGAGVLALDYFRAICP